MDNVNNASRSLSAGFKPLRWLSALLFLAALVGIAVLLLSDAARHYSFAAVHQRIAAFPLLLIGLSYICLQLSARRPLGEMVKGILLGLAFVLWGGEQLLPPMALVTVMDGTVVAIFVVDLGLIIVEHLRRKDHELP